MTEGLASTNVWLAVIALVSLAEFLIIIAAGIVGFRLYRRATALIDRTESEYVAPLAGKVTAVVVDAQETVRRVQQLEERAASMLTHVEDTASRVASVAQYAWPVLGTWRAVSAAVSSLRGGHHPQRGRALTTARSGMGPRPLPRGPA
jgi:hypothetical protein